MQINLDNLSSVEFYFKKQVGKEQISMFYTVGDVTFKEFHVFVRGEGIKEMYEITDKVINSPEDASDFFKKINLKSIRKKYKNIETQEAGREQ